MTHPAYDKALAEYNSIEPVRGRPKDGPRPVEKRGDWVRTIRVENDKVIYRLYRTDCITIHKDGDVVVDLAGRTTTMTIGFINSFMPDCVRFSVTTSGRDVLIVDRYGYIVYRTMGPIRLTYGEHGEYILDPRCVIPFKSVRTDIRAVNAFIKKHNLGVFRDWLRAVERLNPVTYSRSLYGGASPVLEKIAEGQSSWMEIYEYYGKDLWPKLRAHIVREYKLLRVTEHPYLRMTAALNALRSERKYE